MIPNGFVRLAPFNGSSPRFHCNVVQRSEVDGYRMATYIPGAQVRILPPLLIGRDRNITALVVEAQVRW